VELEEDLLGDSHLEKSERKHMKKSVPSVGKKIFLKVPDSIGDMTDTELEKLASNLYSKIINAFEIKAGKDDD
jgi:hypothetical protein